MVSGKNGHGAVTPPHRLAEISRKLGVSEHFAADVRESEPERAARVFSVWFQTTCARVSELESLQASRNLLRTFARRKGVTEAEYRAAKELNRLEQKQARQAGKAKDYASGTI